MAAPKPPQPPSTAVNAFLAGMAKLAKAYNVTSLVVTLRDPMNGEARLFGAAEAMSDLRDITRDKFGLFDVADTGWDM